MSPLISTSAYDASYPTFPILSILSMVLVAVPAYWQFKAGNVGTSLYITWTFIGNMIYLVNSILWYGNLEQHSRFWCDLCTKLMIGMSVGLPAASLIINRRLYKISTVQTVHVSKSESRRNLCIELALGVGLPVLIMALHIINQGHRYDVVENIGCWPSIYMTPMSVALIFIWPILLSMCSVVYCTLSIRAFFRQRRAFLEVLQSTNSGLNVNRYFRLMALAATELCFGLPFSVYVLAMNISGNWHPWISWANTHADFNRTEYVPWGIFMLYRNTYIIFQVTRYALPAGGFFFFFYLGLSGEAGQFWARRVESVKRLCGWTPKINNASPQSSWTGQNGITVHTQNQVHSYPQLGTTMSTASSMGKRDSFDEIYGIPTLDSKAKANSSTDSLSSPELSSAGSSSDRDSKHGDMPGQDIAQPTVAPHNIV
ncbi:a-factor receptor [Tulasnella sp. JGI-2019a]|nr:a-factor receptor [Tulasnella sp. JGI-2019a]